MAYIMIHDTNGALYDVFIIILTNMNPITWVYRGIELAVKTILPNFGVLNIYIELLPVYLQFISHLRQFLILLKAF